MIFHHDIDLPFFVAFDLLKGEQSKRTIWEYCLPYIDLVLAHQEAISILEQLRQQYVSIRTLIIVSGSIGQIAYGYSSETKLSADEAETYHRHQIELPG